MRKLIAAMTFLASMALFLITGADAGGFGDIAGFVLNPTAPIVAAAAPVVAAAAPAAVAAIPAAADAIPAIPGSPAAAALAIATGNPLAAAAAIPGAGDLIKDPVARALLGSMLVGPGIPPILAGFMPPANFVELPEIPWQAILDLPAKANTLMEVAQNEITQTAAQARATMSTLSALVQAQVERAQTLQDQLRSLLTLLIVQLAVFGTLLNAFMVVKLVHALRPRGAIA